MLTAYLQPTSTSNTLLYSVQDMSVILKHTYSKPMSGRIGDQPLSCLEHWLFDRNRDAILRGDNTGFNSDKARVLDLFKKLIDAETALHKESLRLVNLVEGNPYLSKVFNDLRQKYPKLSDEDILVKMSTLRSSKIATQEGCEAILRALCKFKIQGAFNPVITLDIQGLVAQGCIAAPHLKHGSWVLIHRVPCTSKYGMSLVRVDNSGLHLLPDFKEGTIIVGVGVQEAIAGVIGNDRLFTQEHVDIAKDLFYRRGREQEVVNSPEFEDALKYVAVLTAALSGVDYDMDRVFVTLISHLLTPEELEWFIANLTINSSMTPEDLEADSSPLYTGRVSVKGFLGVVKDYAQSLYKVSIGAAANMATNLKQLIMSPESRNELLRRYRKHFGLECSGAVSDGLLLDRLLEFSERLVQCAVDSCKPSDEAMKHLVFFKKTFVGVTVGVWVKGRFRKIGMCVSKVLVSKTSMSGKGFYALSMHLSAEIGEDGERKPDTPRSLNNDYSCRVTEVIICHNLEEISENADTINEPRVAVSDETAVLLRSKTFRITKGNFRQYLKDLVWMPKSGKLELTLVAQTREYYEEGIKSVSDVMAGASLDAQAPSENLPKFRNNLKEDSVRKTFDAVVHFLVAVLWRGDYTDPKGTNPYSTKEGVVISRYGANDPAHRCPTIAYLESLKNDEVFSQEGSPQFAVASKAAKDTYLEPFFARVIERFEEHGYDGREVLVQCLLTYIEYVAIPHKPADYLLYYKNLLKRRVGVRDMVRLHVNRFLVDLIMDGYDKPKVMFRDITFKGLVGTGLRSEEVVVVSHGKGCLVLNGTSYYKQDRHKKGDIFGAFPEGSQAVVCNASVEGPNSKGKTYVTFQLRFLPENDSQS